MDGIFISYRRDDSAGYAGRLYDRLSAHFGPGQVFMDVEGIELGTDFVTAIEQAVGSCQVLIVVIGDEWLSTTDPAGRRRLDDPHDFVRLETRVALERKIRVVPVLVGGALMPRADDLPDELRSLARRQAIEISHKQWESSTRELIRALNTMLGLHADVADGGTGLVPEVSREHPSADVAPAPGPDPTPSRWGGTALLALSVLGAGALGAAFWTFWPAATPPLPPGSASTTVLIAEAARSADSAPAVAAAAPVSATDSAPLAVAAAPVAPAAAPASVAVPTAPAAVLRGAAGGPVPPPPAARTRPNPPTPAARSRPVEPGLPAAPDPVTAAVAPAPAAAAAVVARAPEPVNAANTGWPRPGESWTYRTSGKWPTSPRRDIVIAVQSVREGSVTEALRADAAARLAGDVQRTEGAQPGFVQWSQIGLEYSPYLGAFRDLGTLGSQSHFPTPNMDAWGQWHSQAKVLGREAVSVPGGRFEAFKVEVWSSRPGTEGPTQADIEPVRIHYLVWYAPEVKRYVKMQRRVISANNREIEKDVFELVAQR